MTEREALVTRLRNRRPRDRFVRASLWLFALLILSSLLVGGFDVGDIASPRRLANLRRFLGEAQPFPMQQGDYSVRAVSAWAWKLLDEHGLEAALTTLAIAVASIVMAGAGALLMTVPAARNIASAEPFLPAGRVPTWKVRCVWNVLVWGSRGFLIFSRAIPEYIWAFLFLALLGPHAWPAVLALALHNTGILGKLGAEVVENVEPAVPAALRALGSRRLQIAAVGLFPLVFPRFLLYFVYRWETCVREATVLGMLGFSSLGYWIQDSRARDRYDEMLFLILLGAALVLVGDFVSAVVRGYVRRAN